MQSEFMHRIFDRLARYLLRWRWAVILFFAVLLGFGMAGLPRIGLDTSSENWFMEDDPMRKSEEAFKEIFGNNEYVAVLVSADNIFDAEILTRIRALGRALEREVPYADAVLSIADMEFTEGDDFGIHVGQLIPDPVPGDTTLLEALKEKGLARPMIAGRLVSEDAKEAWVLLRLKPYAEGLRDEHGNGMDMAIGEKALSIVNRPEFAMLTPMASGMPVISADKTAFFKKETVRNMMLSIMVTALVLGIALRTLAGVFYPIVTAVLAILVVFGVEGWMGVTMDPSMVLVPVYMGVAVSIGYAIHLFRFFYRELYRTGDRKGAVRHAVAETGWPMAFTALTTIGALMAFLLVDVKPIRWTGMTAAGLVAMVWLMVGTLLPVLLSFGPGVKQVSGKKREEAAGRVENMLAAASFSVMGHPKKILFAFAILTLILSAGIFRLEVSFDIRKTFGLKIPYVARIDQVGHSQVGSLYSWDLLLTFDTEGMIREPHVLRRLETLIQEMESLPLTKKTTSILPIIKDLNQVVHDGDPAFYALPETREMTAQLLLLYENGGGEEARRWTDYEDRRLRVMVEMGDYNSRGAREELEYVKHRAKSLFPEAHVGLAGSVARFTVMQNLVSKGQLMSFGMALCIVSLLMGLVFGSLRMGLISMIPNIAPALAVGGVMGWCGIPLDMMTITIMPMLLGLSVDDTIHFISHARLAFERCGSYAESMRRTFMTIGLSLVMTSLVIIANFSVYLTSVAKVYVNLGLLTALGITAALLADGLVTPVLLKATRAFGREGKDFAGSGEKEREEKELSCAA